MVVKNPLSKIREIFEIHQLEKRIEDTYRKYGEITLESVRGSLEALKREKEISENVYRRVLEILLSKDVIEFMNYAWEKYYKKIGMISSLITYGIMNFAKYIEERDMLKDFIEVLKIYSEIYSNKTGSLVKGIPLSELISVYMLNPPYYGTLLKVGDSRIPSAVKCTLDELLKEETKQKARENKYIIHKIIVNCAERSGFRPEYTTIKHRIEP